MQTQLAERRSLEENTTETGFVKKGGIYLIDTRSQLISLSQMIQERLEIESDISAAEASYRLRSNIELGTYWFSIGTEETPFCGNFDGDGHWTEGNFSFSVPEMRAGGWMPCFHFIHWLKQSGENLSMMP